MVKMLFEFVIFTPWYVIMICCVLFWGKILPTAISRSFLRKNTDYQFWKNKSACSKKYQLSAYWCYPKIIWWKYAGMFLAWAIIMSDSNRNNVMILDGIFWQKNNIVTLYYVLEHLWYLYAVYYLFILPFLTNPNLTQIESQWNQLSPLSQLTK